MSTTGAGQARAVTRELLAACSPAGDPAEAPVSAAFRCWTPWRDWEQGEAGMAALTQAVASFCGRGGRGGRFRPDAVITDGQAVVVEAVVAAEAGQPPVSMTLLLVLSAGLVDEVRVYLDPRAF